MKWLNSLTILFAFNIPLYSQVINQWKIPHPDSVVHPGARSAPASDPRNYPFELQYQARAESLIAALASYDIWNYRKGYFQSGNDPGKRVPAHAGARLLLNPEDPEALAIMNDNRSYAEHYHFAAVNWARYLPIFRASLTEDIFQKLGQKAATYSAYTTPAGTENHKVMSFTSGLVLPYYLESDRIGNMSNYDAQVRLKNMLKNYLSDF